MRYFAATMSLRIILLLGVVVSAFGCMDDTAITYELSGGAGPPCYLDIDLHGEMTRFHDGSTDMRTLDAMELEVLWQRVDEAQFATLDALYSDGRGGADEPVSEIRVQRDGTFYQVVVIWGAGYPERLQPVLRGLHNLLIAGLLTD